MHSRNSSQIETGVHYQRNRKIFRSGDTKHQRAFLDQVAATLNITSPEEWKLVTPQQIKALGGGKLLLYYPSLYDALRTLYPEHNWVIGDTCKRIPRGHWNKHDNRRAFLDSLARKFGIASPRDWANVSVHMIRKFGGSALLKTYSSMYDMLRSVYPEQNFDFFLDGQQLPNYYWNDPANVRSFISYVSKKRDIELKDEWFDLPDSALTDVYGGTALLQKYGSLINILQIAYPDEVWDPELYQGTKPSERKRLFAQITRLLPNEEVIQRYSRDDIRVNGKKIKFFCYVPSLQLVVKYHSKADYRNLGLVSSLDMYDNYDKDIVSACDEQGLKMVVIPYWYDWSPLSLHKLIVSTHPSLGDKLPQPSS